MDGWIGLGKTLRAQQQKYRTARQERWIGLGGGVRFVYVLYTGVMAMGLGGPCGWIDLHVEFV